MTNYDKNETALSITIDFTAFLKKYSAAVIGLQMASAYVGSTFMPLVFGILQQHIGIGIMPIYLLVFAALNLGLLHMALRKVDSAIH